MKINISNTDVLSLTLHRSWEIIIPAYEGWTVHLSRRGGEYIMTSPMTGVHRLCVAETTADRLRAHWDGFIRTNFAYLVEVG